MVSYFRSPLCSLEIVHISDTHFGPNRNHEIRGSQVLRRVEMLVEQINELPFQPEFIIHTGDVVNDPDEDAYRLAESVLSRLQAPVYYATGNHDDREMMRRFLTFGDYSPLLADGVEVCYKIESEAAAGEKTDFFILDGMVPAEQGPHGYLSEHQIEALLNDLNPEHSTALFLHFPMLPIGSAWIDEHLPVKNGAEVLELVREKIGSRLLGVFTGHIHRGLQMNFDGVMHSGVSSPVCEFTAGPEDDFCDFLPDCGVPFHHISLNQNGVSVKAYSLPFHG